MMRQEGHRIVRQTIRRIGLFWSDLLLFTALYLCAVCA